MATAVMATNPLAIRHSIKAGRLCYITIEFSTGTESDAGGMAGSNREPGKIPERRLHMRNKMLGLVLICLLATTFAAAQASRTWVSGVGDDVNPCSRTAPCKTFAGAISKTTAGGEIDALDPGGYGAVTITKAITIDGGGGQGA